MTTDRAAVLARFLPELSLDGPVEPFIVLADALQQHGDAWGELIAISCHPPPWSDDVLARWQGLLREHGRDLCPFYDTYRVRGVAIGWSRGFVEGAIFTRRSVPARDLPELLAVPAAALITMISFVARNDDLSSVLLAHRDRLARVSRLDLGYGRFSPQAVADLRHAFPSLVVRDR